MSLGARYCGDAIEQRRPAATGRDPLAPPHLDRPPRAELGAAAGNADGDRRRPADVLHGDRQDVGDLPAAAGDERERVTARGEADDSDRLESCEPPAAEPVSGRSEPSTRIRMWYEGCPMSEMR